MAGYVNKVIVVGNLGNDPEIKSFDDGGKIATLSIATTEKWKDRNSGEQREKTEWHRVIIRQNGGSNIINSFIEPYVKKGHKVYVEGKLETRKWDQDGVTRYATEIIVSGPGSSFELLTPPKVSHSTDPDEKPIGVSEDEIPF